MKRCPYCFKTLSEDDRCDCEYEKSDNARIEDALHPGSIVGACYQIGSVLGKGGFGITYRAFDLNMQKVVAIKEFYPDGMVTRARLYGTSSQNNFNPSDVIALTERNRDFYKKSLDLFYREAIALGKLEKLPNVVHAHHIFRENGTAYIVMEFVEGKSLKKIIEERGLIPEDELIPMLNPALEALQKVHSLGILHRDIAPDNIMIEDGEPVLLDFGAARVEDNGHYSSLLIGKKGFSSPEQMAGEPLDERSDIYSLGATYYKALSGETPQDSVTRLFGDRTVPLNELAIKISPHVCDAVMKAMAVRPDDRWVNADEFQKALNSENSENSENDDHAAVEQTVIYTNPIISDMPESKPKKKTALIPAATLLLLAAASFFFIRNKIFTGPVSSTDVEIQTQSAVEYTQTAEEKLRLNTKQTETVLERMTDEAKSTQTAEKATLNALSSEQTATSWTMAKETELRQTETQNAINIISTQFFLQSRTEEASLMETQQTMGTQAALESGQTETAWFIAQQTELRQTQTQSAENLKNTQIVQEQQTVQAIETLSAFENTREAMNASLTQIAATQSEILSVQTQSALNMTQEAVNMEWTRVAETQIAYNATQTKAAEPTFTSTPFPTNTPTPTATNTPIPTNTPLPTATNTPLPTNTPTPTITNTHLPTSTQAPTATNTPLPTNTPTPTATNTPVPTDTPIPTTTNTPLPTNTPKPTAVNLLLPTPTMTPAKESLPSARNHSPMEIANTNADVYLRFSPSSIADLVRVIPINSPVELTGEGKYSEGMTWFQVHTQTGQLGWIPETSIIFTDDEERLSEWVRIVYQSGNYKNILQSLIYLANTGNAEAQFRLGYMYNNAQGVNHSDKTASEWYIKAADQGHAEAQFRLGDLYYFGSGVSRSYGKAAELCQKAAGQGLAEAQFRLGDLYYYGRGVSQSYEKAAELYQSAADQGLASAQYYLGTMYENGIGIQKSQDKAIEWYQKAAAQDYAPTQKKLTSLETDLQQFTNTPAPALPTVSEDDNHLTEIASVNADVSVRTDPSSSADLVRVLRAEDPVTLTGKIKNAEGIAWIYVRTQSGMEGWIPETNITIINDVESLISLGENAFSQGKYDNALKYLEPAAEAGNAVAQYRIGYMYNNGKGLKQSYEKAFDWYLKAGGQGNADAQNQLGYMYYYGIGVQQSHEKAAEWYQKAADQGIITAIIRLETLITKTPEADVRDTTEAPTELSGEASIADDYEKAMENLIPANEIGLNDTESLSALGEKAFIAGDYKKALEYLIPAADAGNADAQYRLGYLYCYGWGTQQSYEKAIEWYQKAADQESAAAQYNLGIMHEKGWGVQQSSKKAWEFYKKAAEQGFAAAQYNVGVMYEQGNGVQQSLEDAVLWYQKAADQEYEAAKASLRSLLAKIPQMANTDISLRVTPSSSADIMRVILSGNPVTLTGEHTEAEGILWLRVQTEQGQEGWIPESSITRSYNVETLTGLGEKAFSLENYNSALRYLLPAAEAGNANAQYRLGYMYNYAYGIQRSYETASEWYQKAADQGHIEAQFRLGDLYFHGRGVEQSYDKAFEWSQKAAEAGNANAQFNLGLMYENGQGVQQSFEMANEWYQKAAEQGQQTAQKKMKTFESYLSRQEATVQPVTQVTVEQHNTSGSEAIVNTDVILHFTPSASGDTVRVILADNQVILTGETKNTEGVKWVHVRTESGHEGWIPESNLIIVSDAENLTELGENAFSSGNYDDAMKYLTLAAEAGSADAQYRLGYMYDNGRNVKRSIEDAVNWYQKAAEQGHARAQYRLGYIYYNGQGMPRSYEKAAGWYQKAAEQGISNAQYILGVMYENGQGVQQSLDIAIDWYRKAAEQGSTSAQKKLKSLTGNFSKPEN